ncbi:hypothetical protein QQ020_34825 [Fulvivirgaceae bacterium BMA12]|uniref:Uncharacterized protein n=1 Tax=Agaribacillus aureus TaxID=3051825 RepID=A0ABT8LHM0_9BACT|nr:hypothetical protein [Fulvivirgaceae bacterium BMA12]
MNSAGYDQLSNLITVELNREYPNVVKLKTIVEESNCPYLRKLVLTKIKAFKNGLPIKK